MSKYNPVLSRRLPHIHRYGMVQFVTFRLHDALPLSILREIMQGRNDLGDQALINVGEKIESFLDAGHGHLWLRVPEVADVVMGAVLHGNGVTYDLHAWVVMPNHVHVSICPYENQCLSKIIQSWKAYSAKRANALLERQGQFWEKDYFDRFMRDQAQYARTIGYIEDNPVAAGLCDAPQDWRWSSAAYPRID